MRIPLFLFFYGICIISVPKLSAQVSIVHSEKLIMSTLDMFGEFIPSSSVQNNYRKEPAMVMSVFKSSGYFYFVNPEFSTLNPIGFWGYDGDTIVIESDSDFITISTLNGGYFDKRNRQDVVNNELFNRRLSKKDLLVDFKQGFYESRIKAKEFENFLYSSSLDIPEQYKYNYHIANMLCRLNYLLSPYNSCSTNLSFSPVDEDSSKYFNEIDSLFSVIHQMTNEELILNQLWIGFVIDNYLSFKLKNYAYEPDCANRKLEFIKKEFKGLLFDAALTKLFLKEGLRNSFFDDNMAFYFSNCQNLEFKNLIKTKISKITDLTSSEVGKTKLYTTSNSNIEFEQLLKLNLGKVVYIDIWASWCAGCKKSIPEIHEFLNNKNIPMIYISVDKSPEIWKKSLTNWSFPSDANHFLLNPSSDLAQIISNPSIPRGILLNKNGEILGVFNGTVNDRAFQKALIVAEGPLAD